MSRSFSLVSACVMEDANLLLFFIPSLFWSCAADTCLKNCFLTSTNVSYTCENISTDRGYTLRVPEIVPVECMTRCEHGWYDKDDTFLVDLQNPKSSNLPTLITEVTPWYLTTHSCLDGAYWQMDCHCSSNAIFVTSYIAVKRLKHADVKDGEKGSDSKEFHLLWLLCIPVLALLCYCTKKRLWKSITEAALPRVEFSQADYFKVLWKDSES